MFPEILRNGIWHETSVERYKSILLAGNILPNPPIPEAERWGTSRGPDFHPYVRRIGGVSLFDFRNFNEIEYSERYPSSSWRYFVPCFKKWDTAVWIELNPQLIQEQFIDGIKLLADWKRIRPVPGNLMPMIEAAHVGPIPIAAFSRALKYDRQFQDFAPIHSA
jgi:hypothetical protein